MTDDSFSTERTTSTRRVLNDGDKQSDSLSKDSDTWIDEAIEEIDNSDRSENDRKGARQDGELTITVCRKECKNCSWTSTQFYHDDCEAPIINIGGEWKCGACGARISKQDTCFDCGAPLEYNGTTIPVDLSLRIRSDDLEQTIHEETNRQRANHGVNQLEYDHHLSAIAFQHSRDMAQRDFFAHTNPDGDEPSDRYRKFGHDDRSSGENISLEHHEILASPTEVARSIVEGWMNSQGHRENVLRDRFTKEGIGVYLDNNGGVYATQNFY